MLLEIQNTNQVRLVEVYKHAVSPKYWQGKIGDSP